MYPNRSRFNTPNASFTICTGTQQAGGQARMSLQIAVAHTGQRLDADAVAYSSVDALKHWISRATAIPPEYQILLTTQGKHVKLQALLTEVRPPLQVLLLDSTNMFTRRRSSSTVANYPITHRLPYRPPLSPIHLRPKTRQIRSPTTQTSEHGKPYSRPAATGPLPFSRHPTPCRA